MLRVLIVDDDSFSRTDLKTMIEWENRGFCITGEANNGLNAIQLMEKELPDIVITDMYMPSMDGIGLIDYIEQNYPQIRVIAVSAYDDFDYVRQSMKKGAIDYVLKHRLNAAVLMDMLETARNSIIQYRDECNQRNFMSDQISSGRAILAQEFILKLVSGTITDKAEIRQTIGALDIKMDTENLVIAISEIDDYPFIEEKYSSKERGVLIQTFLEIAKEMLSDWEKAPIFQLEKGKFIIVFSLGVGYSRLYINNRLSATLDRIRTGIKKYLNITACFGVGKLCRDISVFSMAYREADIQLKNKFYQGKDGIFMSGSAYRHEEGFFCLDIKEEKEISMALRALDYEKVKGTIDLIFEKISSQRLGIKSTQMICAELINIVNKVLKETGLEISKIYTNKDIPYNMLQKYETISDIKEWLLGIYGKLIVILESIKSDHQHSDITKKVIEFINRNYQKDISLSDVADFIGVSNSYISRVFKEDCRMGFVEYLNHIRVENARNYINNGEYKLKEIVTKTGFNNYNYFFKVFKEIVGMTPLEYEQNCKK
ncbi:two-component system response regulator YesN [Hydrogenispora ethanolica]|uniref:Two-component system response regulator YesN n=1 Tax=Hydrogenispora ethanolica TaxID=1082276 RepID=A0A4R1S5S6_HYDET|nr:response regulator [Hydrogenispora ethanolica]TCL74120.1 two-component system response regulator YesN [Hydrogenispora ethanolica]